MTGVAKIVVFAGLAENGDDRNAESPKSVARRRSTPGTPSLIPPSTGVFALVTELETVETTKTHKHDRDFDLRAELEV